MARAGCRDEAVMELQNKTVLFLGDSITEGVGVSAPDKSFVSVFRKLTRANTVNYGISGTRIARKSVPSACANWDMDFLMRVDDMQPEADLVVVFGGTNDFGHGDAELGCFSSRDAYTFYGALHHLCRKLLDKYPRAELVFLTPLHRLGEENTKNAAGMETPPLEAYVTAIRTVAGYYGLPVLDLFHTSGLQPAVDTIRQFYMPDGLHPSDAGAERIAKRLAAFLRGL